MLAILNSSNAHNCPIFQPILMILVSKFMVHRALSDNAVPFNSYVYRSFFFLYKKCKP